jgi:hypothetical protein
MMVVSTSLLFPSRLIPRASDPTQHEVPRSGGELAEISLRDLSVPGRESDQSSPRRLWNVIVVRNLARVGGVGFAIEVRPGYRRPAACLDVAQSRCLRKKALRSYRRRSRQRRLVSCLFSMEL